MQDTLKEQTRNELRGLISIYKDMSEDEKKVFVSVGQGILIRGNFEREKEKTTGTN